MLGTNGYISSCKLTTTRGRNCQSKSNCMLSKPAASSTMLHPRRDVPGYKLELLKSLEARACVYLSQKRWVDVGEGVVLLDAGFSIDGGEKRK